MYVTTINFFRAYKDIADCYYIKTAKVCGNSAAAIIKELLESIIDSILTINCDNVKQDPSVKDPMPEEYIKKENKVYHLFSKRDCYIIIFSLIE